MGNSDAAGGKNMDRVGPSQCALFRVMEGGDGFNLEGIFLAGEKGDRFHSVMVGMQMAAQHLIPLDGYGGKTGNCIMGIRVLNQCVAFVGRQKTGMTHPSQLYAVFHMCSSLPIENLETIQIVFDFQYNTQIKICPLICYFALLWKGVLSGDKSRGASIDL